MRSYNIKFPLFYNNINFVNTLDLKQFEDKLLLEHPIFRMLLF